MSFGRLIKRTLESAKGGVSFTSIIDTQITKENTLFSKRTLYSAVYALHKKLTTSGATEAEIWEELMQVFSRAYAPARRKIGVFHPSQLERTCDRRSYYEVSGVKPTEPTAGRPSPSVQRIFDVGTWWHLYIQNLLHRAGVLECMEVLVEDDSLGIYGRGDGIVDAGGTRRLLEIKSINSFGYSRLTAPKPEHVYQASLYAHILKLPEIVFLYINKDSGDIKEFVIEVDMKAVAKATAKIKKIQSAIARGEAPDRECRDRYVEQALGCKWCSHCFSHSS